MTALYFEFKKFQNKQLIFLLLLIPILVNRSLYAYRANITVEFRSQEQQTANRLLSDLSWCLAEFNEQWGY